MGRQICSGKGTLCSRGTDNRIKNAGNHIMATDYRHTGADNGEGTEGQKGLGAEWDPRAGRSEWHSVVAAEMRIEPTLHVSCAYAVLQRHIDNATP